MANYLRHSYGHLEINSECPFANDTLQRVRFSNLLTNIVSNYSNGCTQTPQYAQYRLLTTVWCTQKAMAQLFDVGVPAISKHLNNIFAEGELRVASTVSKMEIVQVEGDREIKRQLDFYNLDAIISVGYRVSSTLTTQFRQWCTFVLRQFAIRGYAIDKKRIENSAFLNIDYFEHLLAEIREIHLSEHRFYQRLTDIYATSIDYNRDAPTSRLFFKKVENKMHYATYGHTASAWGCTSGRGRHYRRT